MIFDSDDDDDDDRDDDDDDDDDADVDESIEINYENWQIGVNLDGYSAFFLFAYKKLQ